MTITHWSLLLATAAAFATSLPFNKLLVVEMSPLGLAAARAVLAFPVMWLIARAAGRGLPSSRGAWHTAGIAALLTIVATYTTIAWGQQFIPSSLGGILYATMPLATVLLAPFVVRDEPLSARKLFGAGVGIAGVMAILGPKAGGTFGADLVGALVTLLAPVSYALGNLFLRRRPPLHPLELASAMLLVGAAVLVPLALAVDGVSAWRAVPPPLWPLLGLATVGTALPVLLNCVLVRVAGATHASLVMFFMPAFAVAYGVRLLDESIDTAILLGMGLIVVGSRIVTQSSPRKEPRA